MSRCRGGTITVGFESLLGALRIVTSSGTAPSEEVQLAQELLAALCSELLGTGEQTSELSPASF